MMNARTAGFLLASALLLLSACISEVRMPGDTDGIGGTGVIADSSTDGIGGTGVSDPNDEDSDGIGGTGVWASTGDVALYGVVTSTAPLTVNGHSMLVDADTKFSLNGEAANQTALQLGSVAWVKAGIRHDGIFANEVMLQHHVRGPVDFYDEANGLLRVLGQNVTLTNNGKTFGSEVKQLVRGAVSEERWVEVAGIRRDANTIDASLITLSENETTAFVRGLVVKQGATEFRIGDLAIGELDVGGSVEQGAQLLISGKINLDENGTSTLQITSGVASPVLPFTNEVSYYSVQGYFSRSKHIGSGASFAGFPQVLEIAPKISDKLSGISTTEPMVLDVEPVHRSNTLKVLRINRLDPLRPETMLIPQYKPHLPSGEFTGSGGMKTEQDNAAEAILLPRHSIENKTVVPDAVPTLPTVRPDVRIDAPSLPPQIRTAPPADIVRPQIPDVQPPSIDVLPGSVGPR